jgi:general secretion pathway protein A
MSLQEFAATGPQAASRPRDFAAFRLTPDLRFIFPQAAHEAAFAALLDALRRNADGVLLAIGDVGVGKTMLARRLERELVREGTRAAYFAYPDLNRTELLRSLQVVFEFGPAPDGDGLDAGEILRLAARAPATRHVILLDDADRCSTELLSELEGLVREARTAGASLQTVLFGTPDLTTRLSTAAPSVALAAAGPTRLEPLSLEETGPYIRHRLAVLGGRQDVFSTDAIEAIASYARGVPRLVNQACGRALLLAGPDRDGAISQAMVLEAIGDCPAIALADPRAAAWAAATPADVPAESSPAAPDAATIAEPVIEPEHAEPPPAPAPAAEPEPAVAAPQSSDASMAPQAQLQVPEPPSARAADPARSRQGKRPKRPAPDRLRPSMPAQTAAPPEPERGPAAPFAGFVPLGSRTKAVPAVAGAGAIDEILLRKSSPMAARHGRAVRGAIMVAVAAIAAVGVFLLIDPDFARPTRDRLAGSADATFQDLRGIAADLAGRVFKPAGQP